MLVNWQAFPEPQRDANFEDFSASIESKFGRSTRAWHAKMFAILRSDEVVLEIASGAYIRLRDAKGERVTLGSRAPLAVAVTNQRIIWLSDGYLFWSFENVAHLSPIVRGDLCFTMKDDSRVQIAFELWMLKRDKLRSVSKTVSERT